MLIGDKVQWADGTSKENYTLWRQGASDSKIWMKSNWSVELHQVLTLWITQLMEDIRDSVLRHSYLLPSSITF